MSMASKRGQAESLTPPDSPSDAAQRKKLASAALRANTPSKSKSAKKVGNFDDVRKYLLTKVAAGTPVIRKMQEYRSTPLDWFFIIWSFLGDRFLYIYSLPWFFWVYDPALGRKFLLLLIYGTTFGNFLKNIFALPRPPSPPLWSPKKLEDFGLPSTHSLNAVTMPWFLLYSVWDRIPTEWHIFAVGFAIFYSFSMFLSRQYLAAHSLADVISGIILGIPLLFLWIHVCEDYDTFIRTSFWSPAVTLTVAFLVVTLHPRASRPSPSHRYSLALMGLASGGILGVWALINWGESGIVGLRPDWPDVAGWIQDSVASGWQHVAQNCFNAHFGIVLMLFAFAIVKVATYITISFIFDLSGVSPMFKTLQTSFSKLAMPHALALDNLDHPQFKKDKEGHDSNVASAKNSAKLISEFMSTLAVGFCNAYVTPVLLYCLNCISKEFLSY